MDHGKQRIYLNDFTAALNERTMVAATAHSSFGRHFITAASSPPPSRIYQPSTIAAGLQNENELSGSFAMEWEGSGAAKSAVMPAK